MRKDYLEKYQKIERDYWWFVARRDLIRKFMAEYDKSSKVLEIGCSGGILLKELKNDGFKNLFGVDIDKKAIKLAKKRGLKNVKIANGTSMKFKKNMFDIIIASDVLEHMDEDKAINEWRRVLKPCGEIIIFTPAFKFLWSDHDNVSHHKKRYTKKELKKLLGKNGFFVRRKSYWNFTCFFPVKAISLISKTKGDNLYIFNKYINKLIILLLKLENKIINRGINLPFGVSAFVIGKKL